MFPKRHLRENRSLIFRLLFQTTKNPEVLTVSGICGYFLNFEKFCADVALSALSQYFWSRGPQFGPHLLFHTVPFLESGPISFHGPCFTGSGEIRPAPWPICRPKGPSNSEEAAGLARIGF